MGWNQAGGEGGGGGGGGTPRDAGMCGVTGVCAKGWYNEGSPRNGAGVQDSGCKADQSIDEQAGEQ